ncbi:MAG TPA: alpha/beta hydrolase-fold protein [Chryseolinea sp.]|nr:alpha/beta hydrolase-fold protein [Chryseolinea sp.]
MAILKPLSLWLLTILSFGINYSFSQTQIIGKVISAKNQNLLSYVNIGIKEKNIGTVSKEDGSFAILIPFENQNDSLTFSMVGHYESNLSIKDLVSAKNIIIKLKEKTTQLNEVVISGEKLVEKKYGIKKRGTIHFTDGIFKKDDSFEIGQVINLGNTLAQINSLNIHINSSRPDSANFRINFYRFDLDDNTPKERIVEKSIMQRHPVKEGWSTFDLSDYNILIKGTVLVSLEFIPEAEKDVKQIFYEVKIGGSSKSFFRKTSLGQWTRPPHHYCLYITALTDKHAPDELDDEETPPTFVLKSDFSEEPFSLFVKLPRDYSRNKKQTYPVVYLLDGNAYFDPIANAVDHYVKKKKISIEPIIVGIGYKNAYVMDSLRNRDYTFPKALAADSFKISGEGDKFYNFIRTQIIKQIDSVYRTDKLNRTIMGHSLGGYFVLYTLTRPRIDSPVFNNFVAASPSLYYHDNYLLDALESSTFSKKNSEHIKLYLTIGEFEVVENQPNDFEDFSQILTDKKFNIQTEVYRNLEHMGTAIPTFEDAILLFTSKQNSIRK